MRKHIDFVLLMLLPVPLVSIGLMLFLVLVIADPDSYTVETNRVSQIGVQSSPTRTLSSQAAAIATVNAAPTRQPDFRFADADNGEALFNTFQPAASFACATCHRPDSEERLIGPGLLNVGQRAGTRVEGMSAEDYLRDSIVNPNAYIVDGFPENLMPRNWAEIYSPSQVNDIIAYLLTLEGEEIAARTAPQVSSSTAPTITVTDAELNGGDAQHGQELFNTFQPEAGFACSTCHFPDSEARLIGPGLLNVGERAATRVEGQSVLQYLYISITNPDAYVVDGFPDTLMPEIWAEIYTVEDIKDIMAYLLTLE